MKLLLGSLVAEVNGIEFPLDEGVSTLGRFVTEGPADFVVDAVVRRRAAREWRDAELVPGRGGAVDGRAVTFDRGG